MSPTELLMMAAAFFGALLTFSTLVGLAVRFALVPYLRAELFKPVKETHQQVTVNGNKDKKNPTLLDRFTNLAKTSDEQSTAIADLTSQVQTAVVLAQQAVEGQERIEEQVAAIDMRLDAGEKRFRKLDRVTAALEGVARTNHPEDYPTGPDIED